MAANVTLADLQGLYDITYASTPQIENFYEPGFGSAKIDGNKLTGVDALGVIWNGVFEVKGNGTLEYNAQLDPSEAPITVGLVDRNGQMTREPQSYHGVLNVTKLGNNLILRTQVQQGPITIDVQFRKKQ